MTDTYFGDTNKYSVWLSMDPYDYSGDNQFINLCSDASINISLPYNMTKKNIPGQPPTSTIVMDPFTGSTCTITLSGVRINPVGSDDESEEVWSNARFERWVYFGLLSEIAMEENAHILRVFNHYKDGERVYNDIPICVQSMNAGHNMRKLHEMSVSMTFYKRNFNKGFKVR